MNSLWMAPLSALVAFFYGMVGHGGASGYLAVGALLNEPLGPLKAQALMLNLGVSGMAALLFARARWMRWDLLLPLALGSVPAAYFSSQAQTGAAVASGLLAFALLCSSLRLLWASRLQAFNQAGPKVAVPWTLLLAVGAGLGVLSGLTGVGGGIYLSPLLLFLRWADIKESAACSAAFIFINSLAGLAGKAAQGPLPPLPHDWLFATLVGGFLGAYLGAGWLPQRRLAQVLAVALLLAAYKLGAHALA
jgi:uncharacterized membrane protein YfcA